MSSATSNAKTARTPVKVLQIHWGFLVGGGGCYTQMLELLPSVAPISTHNICILAPGWSVDQAELGRTRHTRVDIRGRLDRSWIGAVCREIKQRNPDVIMTHGFNAHFVAWTCQRRLSRRLPVVCSYHGPYHPASLRTYLFGFAFQRFTEYLLRRYALAVVAVAHHAKARLVRRGALAEKITVIHNGIDENSPSVSLAVARTD